ncbi:hypothetical protein BaRGS_00029935 [Batillaria attramentaria]|uniref:Uncharacterized protein n=1 Tax=Batillaria attramentaria TaxID=370345 RepID=A0ABD0JUR8_9CAEN
MWTSSRHDTTESSTDLAALQTVNCLSCGLLPETIQPNRPQTWLLYRQTACHVDFFQRRYNRIVHRPGCSTDSKLLVMWTSSRHDTTESSTDLAALQTVNCLSCGLLPETIQPNRPQTWLLYRQ